MGKKIKSILLVDDDRDDQMLFKEALSEADGTVLCMSALSGYEALEKLISGVMAIPDIIFMDVNMPRMNGLDCLKEFMKIELLRPVPVIMYSTSCSPAYQRECLANGAAHYIEKPNDFSALCLQIKALLTSGTVPAKNSEPAL